MTELEKTKYGAIDSLKQLCLRCRQDLPHSCPVSRVIAEIRQISGIPVIVNSQLRHVVFR